MSGKPEPANASPDRTITFGPFVLLPSQQLLLKADQPVHLGARAFEILTFLVDRAGDIVSKEELIGRVWPNTFVQEGNLKVHVAALRQALGDGRDGHRYIVNVPGRGYRFVATVSHSTTPPRAVGGANASNRSHNLPTPLTRMFGRADMVSAIASQISQRRFVTIVGPGGIGKTTIALTIANTLTSSYQDGCWFLDLAPIADPRLVPSTLALSLGIGAHSDNLVPILVAFMQGKHLLVVLDSCEHIIDDVAAFAEQLLKGALGVHILATSREPLRAAGEVVRRLPPLEIPPPGDSLTAAKALTFSGVQLFVECAAARVDGFALTDHDAPLVAEICRRLDGNALGIELAAGRVDAFGVSGVAARLVDRFQLLISGRRTALPRHQTLAATLDWSHDLLTDVERTILRRLSVFAGDFTLEAAAAVAADGPIAASDVVDGVANLTAKSLVSPDVNIPIARYRVLDTTSAYARQKLIASGEFAATAQRHAEYFTVLFDRAGQSVSQRAADWRAIQGWHVDNVRAALDWAFGPNGRSAIGVMLTIATVPLWLNLSLMDECRRRVERALSVLRPADGTTPRQQMQLFTALGVALYSIGPGPESRAAWMRVRRIAERLQDTDHQLRAHWGLWTVCVTGGKHRVGLALARRFERLAENARDPEGLLVSKRLVGTSRHFLGEQAAARQLIESMLDHAPPPGNPADILRFQFDQSVAARAFLGRILWLEGRPDAAMRAVERSVADAQAIGHSLSLCYALGQGACPIALFVGDVTAAEHYVALLVDHSTRHGLALWATMGRCFQGIVAIRLGDHQAGLRLLQAAVNQLRDAGYALYHTASLVELADAHARTGQVAAALTAINEALAQSTRNDERWCMAELLRVKAELQLLQATPETDRLAEDCLQQSLDWARRCGSLSWELRAATSLCRLRLNQNRAAEGRAVLTSVYMRFAEGFETADLTTARRLFAN